MEARWGGLVQRTCELAEGTFFACGKGRHGRRGNSSAPKMPSWESFALRLG